VLVVWSEDHRSHNPTRELVMGREVDAHEKPERADLVARTLAERGHELVVPREHGLEPLAAVHDHGYLDYLATAWDEWEAAGFRHPIIPDTIPLGRLLGRRRHEIEHVPTGIRGRAGWYTFDTASPFVAGTYPAARMAADCALTAAEAVLQGNGPAFALCRPPGHHAGRDFAGGYCFLNNSAVAAALLRDRSRERIAVLDLDFHHGNGTQQIFWEQSKTLTISIHGDPDRQFPYFTGRSDEVGGDLGEDANANFPLPAGVDDEGYLAALGEACARVEAFAPAYLVVPFGTDTFVDDPLGDFAVTTSCYERIGARVAALGVPTLVVLEGGYAVDAIGENVASFLAGLES
jgi:acetoin utilization deacetylase AcuC-like enzyme